MKTFLYFLAIAFQMIWMIAFLFYDAPNIIHILVIFSLIVLIARLFIKEKTTKPEKATS